MKTWVRKTINVGVLTAGAILLTAGAAQASIQTATGNHGLVTGNDGIAAGQVSANGCGNGVGVAGGGVGVSDSCKSRADQDVTPITQVSSDNAGIGSGNLVSVVGQIVGNACGNGVGVLGVGVGTSDSCDAGGDQADDGMPGMVKAKAPIHKKAMHKKAMHKKATPRKESSRQYGPSTGGEGSQVSDQNHGLLTGNNIAVPINIAANGCGNGVGVLGAGVGVSDSCMATAHQESAMNQFTGENHGLLTGNNVYIPVNVALDVCGNGVGVLGGGVGVSDVCKVLANQGDSDMMMAKAPKHKKEALPLVGDLPLGQLTGSGLPGGDALKQVPVIGGLTGGLANINPGQNGLDAAGMDTSSLVNAAPTDAVNAPADNTATEGKKIKHHHHHKAAFVPRQVQQGDGLSQISTGNHGLLTGNNIAVPIQLVGNLSGNGVGVLGGGVGTSDSSVAMGHQL